jgi:ABC-type nitrate/sulfonate/bicarbonate transport system substrate-binding protein
MQLAPTLYARKEIASPAQLRGATIGVREKWGLNHLSISSALRKLGIDPERDVTWLEDPLVGYGSPGVGDLLRSGKVTVLPLNASPEVERLLSEGYHAVLDLGRFYLEHGAWPPGKVIVATKQTIENRGEELGAFLRANLRAFWFVQDPSNHKYMFDLDTRLRQTTYNADERKLRMYEADGRTRHNAEQLGARAMGYMVMDGLVSREALADVIAGMVEAGELDHAVAVEDVLQDVASLDAYQQLLNRRVLDRQAIERWRGVSA